MKNRGFLLASFLQTDSEEEILKEVQFLVDNMNLTNQFVFLMGQVDNPTKKVLTYNAITEPGKNFHPRLYTMRMHRKKATNTLYTINALNAAVATQHDGQTGRNLKLDWEPYTNSMLLTAGKKLEVHRIEVLKIFKIEDEPQEN